MSISKIGKANIIDTRMPDFFFGVSKLDFVERAGYLDHNLYHAPEYHILWTGM